MLHMVVVGAPEMVAWARAAPAALAHAIGAGLLRAAVIVESTAKRLVYKGHPAHLKGDTGRLRQSITHRVGATQAEIGTNVIYARIQEYGGTVRGTHSLLAIPVGDMKGSPRGHDLGWAPGAGGGRLVDASGKTQYLLREEVTIPARPFLGPALEQSKDEIREAFQRAVSEALRA